MGNCITLENDPHGSQYLNMLYHLWGSTSSEVVVVNSVSKPVFNCRNWMHFSGDLLYNYEVVGFLLFSQFLKG